MKVRTSCHAEQGKAKDFVGSGSDLDKLGFEAGQVVQELGWDDDVDEDLRQEVMDIIDGDMIEDSIDAVDIVWLWLRADDGDVADGLVDAMRDLSDDGFIVLVTPKVGRPGTIDPADLSDGTDTAGMVLTTSYDVSKDWQAHKIVRPRGGRR
ncbi:MULTISPECIES: DUF3052 domain-containing protein [Cutibacterium]|jgi:hypothetical protein|uniref:DUF3052 domain-containing protein n=1 Tax=Cutibacterium TaxID=1912216 RepID=UPI0001EF2F0F|nr:MULTISPECIES: DUF3052 domain-containing protein [Cutibacterium]OFL28834.1 hypothetical protein HMPREF2773_09495 [Propionibacterium sp. HMSC078F01]OFO86034.1 hypothetical protein HMPREF3013_09345 [Propionibacterium sp. HMSC062D05]OFP23446.1 hypothetical protein HMPREF2995_09805 [Propionibacterium sp. HMSC062D02]OFS43896.1 hypothetical protein HMPREF2895_08000 [Propionibacterium sp. HMSC067A02]OIO58091.1 MAG: hypothetical protein AUJ79_01300 [Propionibacterium sp. CG1_02_60_36]OQY11770.1 MAG